MSIGHEPGLALTAQGEIKNFKVGGLTTDVDVWYNLGRMGKRETKPLNINLDAELHRQVKILAAKETGSMTKIVEAALRFYLDANKGEVDEHGERKLGG